MRELQQLSVQFCEMTETDGGLRALQKLTSLREIVLAIRPICIGLFSDADATLPVLNEVCQAAAACDQRESPEVAATLENRGGPTQRAKLSSRVVG